MSLGKRKGSSFWQCEWTVGGKTIRESSGTADKVAAQEYHDRRRAEIWRESRLGDAPTITWGQAALAWCKEHAFQKASYSTDLGHLAWLSPRLTGKGLATITTEVLIKLRAEQIKAGKAPATANRKLAVVSAILNYAHSKGQVPGVPKIPYLRETSKDSYVWITREQAVALLAELPEPLAAITRFDLATGLRRANATGLMWENIDMVNRVAWVLGPAAKGGKPFSVPLNNDAMAVLESQRALPATWDKHGVRLRDPRYVFTYRGKPVFHTTTKAWKLALARVGVKHPELAIDPKFTFHDLRHSWASWHIMGGTSPAGLKELGAWASASMVERYAHLSGGYVATFVENVALVPPSLPPT
jgi:integrase